MHVRTYVQVLSNCVAAAGFSVGEITALIFAQSLSLEQGIQLVSYDNAHTHTHRCLLLLHTLSVPY